MRKNLYRFPGAGMMVLLLLASVIPVRGQQLPGESLSGARLRSAMIWYPDTLVKAVSFRRQFAYRGAVRRTVLYVFADSKYMLWINGRYVWRGPCRFDPQGPEYDSLEVTKYLRPGMNTLAVQAYGHISTGETMEHTAGLGLMIKRGEELLLVTDTGWRCSVKTRYGAPAVWWDGMRENIHAEAEDGDWVRPACDDRAWVRAVVQDKGRWGAFHSRTTPLQVATEVPFELGGRVLPLELRGKEDLFLKLKKNIVGYCVFELEADSGSRLSVFGHHYTARKGRQEYITGGYFGSGVTNTFGTLIRDEPDSVGIPVHLDTGRVRFEKIRVYNFIAPTMLVGSFHSSDSILDRYWNVIANMHRQVTKDTYTDGVSEGNEWVGDVHNIYQFTRVAFAGPGRDGGPVYADKRWMKKALLDFGYSQQADGRIKAHHPSDRFDLHWFIEDFACTWVSDIRNYLEWADDPSFQKAIWPRVKRQMDWFRDSISARGIVHGREWCIFDNPYAYKRGEGATLNAFVYKAFGDAAWLADRCGDAGTAGVYRGIAAAMKQAFNTNFWDGNKCSFRGMTDSAETLHAAVLALATGICDTVHRRDVENWLLPRSLDTNIVWPYLHQYWFRDLYAMNSEEADQQVLNIIRGRYFNRWNALNKGYVTSEGINRNRNFHNFGMVPGYFLSAWVLGVRTEGTLPDKRIVIEPRLGDLTWADGTVVTEYGPVKVGWKKEGGELGFQFRIPAGIHARIGIPCTALRPTLVLDGETWVREGKVLKKGVVIRGRFICLEMAGGGEHTGRVGEAGALAARPGQVAHK